MKYALYLGCNIPARVNQYDTSARAVLNRLGVRLVDIREFSCCGLPLQNIDLNAFVLSSAENLALAEKADLDMLVLCKCCFGRLKKAEYLLKDDRNLRREINQLFVKKGLKYEGKIQIHHILSVLYHDVGLDMLKNKICRPYKDLKIAVSYGCHALRPSEITRFDDPVTPTLIDRLVEVTGAISEDWAGKLKCCGAPLLGIDDELSIKLAQKKLEDGRKAGADFLLSACPFSHIQFDNVQKVMVSKNENEPIPSILYTQLLGLTTGIDEKTLGVGMNKLDISGVTSFLTKE